MGKSKHSPEKVFQLGNAKVSVFRNEWSSGQGHRTCLISISYSETVGEGTEAKEVWKYTSAIPTKHIATVAYLLQRARDYMFEADTMEAQGINPALLEDQDH